MELAVGSAGGDDEERLPNDADDPRERHSDRGR
jgi:hypothetical protein